MNSILNLVWTFLTDIHLYIYYLLEGIAKLFLPKKLRYKDITGKTVLITGAGNGIGRQLALDFENCNVRLVLLDINLKALNETKELISNKSLNKADIHVYECDLSNRKMIYETARKIKDEVGVVNILINNAGIVIGKKFLDCPDEMIQKTMDVNIMAHFWTCKAFLPDMRAMNHGHIVFVASMAGFMPLYKAADYCASKHAVVGFEEALRLELDHEGYSGIKTTLVAPIFVNTGLFGGANFKCLPVQPMGVETVSKEIISAILSDQEVLLLPEVPCGLLTIFKACNPRKSFRQCLKSFNLSTCMERFKDSKTNWRN